MNYLHLNLSYVVLNPLYSGCNNYNKTALQKFGQILYYFSAELQTNHGKQM